MLCVEHSGIPARLPKRRCDVAAGRAPECHPLGTSFSKLAMKVAVFPRLHAQEVAGDEGTFLSVELLQPPKEVTGPPPDHLQHLSNSHI